MTVLLKSRVSAILPTSSIAWIRRRLGPLPSSPCIQHEGLSLVQYLTSVFSPFRFCGTETANAKGKCRVQSIGNLTEKDAELWRKRISSLEMTVKPDLFLLSQKKHRA
jgi:hypothetical protein